MSEEIEHNWRKAQHLSEALGIPVSTEDADALQERLRRMINDASQGGYVLGYVAGREEILKLCEENCTVLAGSVARHVRVKEENDNKNNI